jgi:hypothetical protein
MRNGMQPKRPVNDLSIQVPTRGAVRDNGPMTAVPKNRARPPSDGLKSARPNLVSTPYDERNPIFTPAMPKSAAMPFPPPPLTASLPLEEKKNIFSKLFKKKSQAAIKGSAII